MNKTIVLVLGLGVVGFGLYYMLKSKAPATATNGQPINSLPARSYALNGNSNPQGQPPTATFTPASGIAVAEGLLGAFGGGGSVNQKLSSTDAQPVSFDTTDTSSTTQYDSGTTTFFG